MTKKPKDLLRRHDALEEADKHDYQWQLRLLQSLWREKQGYPARVENKRGETVTRGAELEVRHAEATLSNYLTETIRKVVCEEVHGPKRKGKLYKKPRIYNHLLSSQPLCFNLFGELAEDLDLASQVLGDMSKGRVSQVTAIEFEWSPGRGDDRYLGDKTPFDIYVIYQNADRRGFLGIEVKYHENFANPNDNYKNHKDRYDAVAAEMGCFREEYLDKKLRGPKPLEQMWRDHLLMGAHRKEDGFDDACFVFLYPEVNTACSKAAEDYEKCLSDTLTFEAWTLDDFVSCLRRHTDAEWVQLFYDRYLDLIRLPREE